MQQVKARDRAYRRKLGNSSLTVAEKKFERRKVIIGKNGFIVKVETLDEHLERMYSTAANERLNPKEPTRVLSRILEVPTIGEMSLDANEKTIIANFLYKPQRQDGSATGEILLRPDITISQVEKAILRYRRLTNRQPEKKLSLGERKERFTKAIRARKAKEDKESGKQPQFKTFSFKD